MSAAERKESDLPLDESAESAAAENIARALALLNAGELVAIPTETVYGLAADARNPAAVAKIFAAKGRPRQHPLIVHLADAAQLDDWASEVPPAARALAQAFWPGPLTMILKRAAGVSDVLTGGASTVGLRVPAHPLTLRLLHAMRAAGGSGALAAPSANRFGRISPTSAAHVRAELGDAVPLVLDGGACAVGIESTIVDLSRGEPRLLRPGQISAASIAAVCGRPLLCHEQQDSAADSDVPRASGTLAAHYAPQTPMRLVTSADLAILAATAANETKRCGIISHSLAAPPASQHLWLRLPADAAGYAHDFYAALRQLDAAPVDRIIVEALPDDEAWRAVADRLQRALTGAGESCE